MRGLVLGDDAGRNPTALADFVPALARPLPDLRTTFPTRAGACFAPTSTRARPPGVVGKCADLLAEFLAVRLAQIDLVRVAVKGERNRLCSFDLTIVRKITDDGHYCLLSHDDWTFPILHAYLSSITYTSNLAADNSQRVETPKQLCKCSD